MADILSQDEIDALLSIAAPQADTAEPEPDDPPSDAPPSDAPPEALIPLPPAAAGRNLEMILRIPLDVCAEIGRTRMTVYELLQLNRGALIQLERKAGDPIDLRVNGKIVARGEAVVVDEKFGLRVQEVDSLQERLGKL